jgi:hypothetical protein
MFNSLSSWLTTVCSIMSKFAMAIRHEWKVLQSNSLPSPQEHPGGLNPKWPAMSYSHWWDPWNCYCLLPLITILWNPCCVDGCCWFYHHNIFKLNRTNHYIQVCSWFLLLFIWLNFQIINLKRADFFSHFRMMPLDCKNGWGPYRSNWVNNHP